MPEPLPVFTQRRQESWTELADLVSRAGGRVTALDAAGVTRLGARYREAVADLAQARRRFPAEAVTGQLDELVRQARPLVYGSVTERRSVAHFAATGYWQRVRERPAHLLISALAVLVPMVAMGFWSHGHPAQAAQVAQATPLTAGVTDGGPRDPDTQKVTGAGRETALATQIFTNNARVALVAYAGGLTGGVLTLVSLVFNGLLLGLVAGYSIRIGAGDSVWRLIIPHGVLELSLIIVSGAAGLRTGWALVHPGHRTRAEALATDGRAGVEMALGCAVLLVPCGLVEGFVTPRGLSTPAALAVGFGLGAVYWAMVVWRGRPDPMRATPSR